MYSQEVKDEILLEIEDNVPISKINAKYNISKGTLYQWKRQIEEAVIEKGQGGLYLDFEKTVNHGNEEMYELNNTLENENNQRPVNEDNGKIEELLNENNILKKALVLIAKDFKVKENEDDGVSGSLKVEGQVIRQIAEDDYKNAGIRGIEKKMRKICRIASKEMEEKERKSYKMSVKRAIDHGLITNQQVSVISEYFPGKTITSGIDYTNGKESLVAIEALFVEKMKEAEIIGRRKEAYEDDLTQLWSYLVNHRSYHGLNEQKVMDGSFVVNVEKLTYFRYDANQRLAIAFAMFSTLLQVVLPKKHVVIGDVSLLGVVSSNNMTKNHIINAIKSGAKVFFVPADMVAVTKKLANVKDVKIIPVRHLREIKPLFYRLFMLNRVNDKIQDKPHIKQADFQELLEHEEKIAAIAKDKDWTMKEAYDKHFSENSENATNGVEEELEKLIGLSEVKDMVQKIITWKEVSRKRKELGLTSKDIGMHMIFTGNPGTGKTTVAKVLGEMLHSKGLTKNDRFIEVTRDDLVGKYIGHTEDKVKAVIKQALGGVLYIDEAHSLFVDSENDFGRIVISTLVKEIEENRDKLIIIMSGYKKEMSEMVKVNPGLEDRINFKIDFADYHVCELTDIFVKLCGEENFEIDGNVMDTLSEIFTGELAMKKRNRRNFSNGRFVRNLFEKAKLQQALRLGKKEKIEDDDYKELKAEDVGQAYDQEKEYKGFEDAKNAIGFSV